MTKIADHEETFLRFVHAVLDDDHGINQDAFGLLTSLVAGWPNDRVRKSLLEMYDAAQATEGRFYLKEGE
jgi:hypothetical protein